jgi:pimeloyl-ACP methyl ester carboxylesterase
MSRDALSRIAATLLSGLALVAPTGAAMASGAEGASHAEGDWLGVLEVTPAVALHIAVHIHRTPDGGYAGTLDSLDQGLFGSSLDDIVAAPDSLSYTAPLIRGRYVASWDKASGHWVGQWSQAGRTWPLALAPGVAPPAPVIADLEGDWDGVLNISIVKLRLAFHFRTGPHGTVGTADSIDQQANGLPVSAITRRGDHIRFEMPQQRAVVEGDLADGGRTIKAIFTQGGQTAPLVLSLRAPGQKQAELKRPQTPVKPYPYHEEEVAYDDAPAHVRLSGTLTTPKGAGPFPAVILVSGSGPNTRNEPILGHQIFLVLADYLTRQGVAVLRYDKRGTGASTGDYGQATTMDFADDADAAVAYLKTRKDIDPRHIGLIGHSEGGLIVPLVAARDPSVSFIVMMAGPGVNGAEVWTEQLRLILKAAGQSDDEVAAALVQRRQMVAILRSEKDPARAADKLRALMGTSTPKEQRDALIAAINTPWFRDFFDYEPAPTLRRLRCPVLAISGSNDLQVSPAQNLPAIRAALAQDKAAEIEELPGLNHLFQTAATGSPAEYGQIEETISPLALRRVSDWVLKQAGG